MFKEEPYEKKQKTHNTFSQKFISGFSVSMVWILRTSRRGWASLFVQAWRDILEASWGFTVIFEGEPPWERETPVKVMIVMFYCYLNKLELDCWCWASIGRHDFSQFRWWDDARWQVRSQKMWCCHKMAQQVSISLAVWCPSPCGRGGASIRMSRDNDIKTMAYHGHEWPWDIRSNMHFNPCQTEFAVRSTWSSSVSPFAQWQLPTVQTQIHFVVCIV